MGFMFVSQTEEAQRCFAFFCVFGLLYYSEVVDERTEELRSNISGETNVVFWLLFTYFWNLTNGNSRTWLSHISFCAKKKKNTFWYKNVRSAVLGISPDNSDKLPDCSARTQKLWHVNSKKHPRPETLILDVATEICVHVSSQ